MTEQTNKGDNHLRHVASRDIFLLLHVEKKTDLPERRPTGAIFRKDKEVVEKRRHVAGHREPRERQDEEDERVKAEVGHDVVPVVDPVDEEEGAEEPAGRRRGRVHA